MKQIFDLNAAQRALPEAIFVADMPSVRAPRLIATGYTHPLRAAFSGISYYLALAGMSNRRIEGCFTLQTPVKPDLQLNALGAMWKLGLALRGRKTRGFKFAPIFNDHVWKKHIHLVSGTHIISNNQIFGDAFWQLARGHGICGSYYIDGTLEEYFGTYAGYDVVAGIDRSTMSTAIDFEREGYRQARCIVAMSARSARNLAASYGVDERIVTVVSPAANIPDDLSEEIYATAPAEKSDDFVLGFVGLYPIRKGLDRLAGAMAILRGRGLPVRLRVIGKCPEEIARMEGVEYLGVINKHTHIREYLEAIAGTHLGCQLSRAELVGIAPIEFSRLGIPILATDLGGVPEVMDSTSGVMVSPEISVEELVEVIGDLVVNRHKYVELRSRAARNRKWASWSRAANEIDAALTDADARPS